MSAGETVIIVTQTASGPRRSWLARRASGLSLGAVTVAAVAAWYAWRCQVAAPDPGSPVGLALGVTGFLMMGGAQTAYTIRKRMQRFNHGRMSTWLHAHIYLGFVGAGLVLLHSAGRLQGVAGAAAGLVVVVVVSGFVGRYVYTAAPRGLDGIEVDVRDLLVAFAAAERQLLTHGVRFTMRQLTDLSAMASPSGIQAVMGRRLLVWRQRRRIHRLVHGLALADAKAAAEIERLLATRFELQLDIQSLAATRRWLAWWHALHVPLSVVMFTLAVVHVVGALAYSRLFF